MMISIVLILVFVSVFASIMNQGLWSNFINLVNVIVAGLVAMNYFEPVAGFLDKQQASATYIYDFIAIWFIFGATVVILRLATDYMSQVKVKFFMPVDKAGGILMAIWVSWIVVCFTATTLHTAPLSRNFMGFQEAPDSKMFFGLQPDRVWMGWVHRESMGALSRFGGARAFDGRADMIVRYSNRRDEYDKQLTFLKGGKAK